MTVSGLRLIMTAFKDFYNFIAPKSLLCILIFYLSFSVLCVLICGFAKISLSATTKDYSVRM